MTPELEPKSLVKHEEDEEKPNRAQRRRGHRIFNSILRQAAKRAIPVTEQAMKAQAKELRRVRNAHSLLARRKRHISAATRNKNRRLA